MLRIINSCRKHYCSWATAAKNSIATQVHGPDRWLGILILLSSGFLILGWLTPIMTVSQLMFLEEQVSILDGVLTLARHGELFLFTMVLVFSVIIPALKLFFSYLLWSRVDVNDNKFRNRLRMIEGLGKWSMTEVFLVALVVAAVKVSVISDIHLHWGLYFFSGSIILSMFALARLTVLAHHLQGNK